MKKAKIKQKKEGRKLKILAAGDIHGDTTLVKKLAEKARKEKVDLVILTGDLTLAETSIENLIGPFTKAKEKVLIIPGNHETLATANFLEELYPNVKNIHGKGIKARNIGIFGAGSGEVGLFKLREKDIYDLLEKGFKKIRTSKKKIMVTHVHPSGTRMEKFSTFVRGSKAIKEAIKKFKPDIALCSHVHEAAGLEEKIGKTRVINVGRKGKIIEV